MYGVQTNNFQCCLSLQKMVLFSKDKLCVIENRKLPIVTAAMAMGWYVALTASMPCYCCL